MASPEDEAIGMAKKRRLMKLEKEKEKQAETKPPPSSFSVGECDIGASPQMSKGKLMPVKKVKQSPLQGTRELTFK